MEKRDVALIILYDSEKRVLLQFRDDKTPNLPLQWAFFGGGIEKGETPEQAGLRECVEELDYKLKNPKLILTQKFKDANYYGTKHIFAEECKNKSVLKLQEGQDWGWYKLSETQNLKMADHDREVLKDLAGKI